MKISRKLSVFISSVVIATMAFTGCASSTPTSTDGAVQEQKTEEVPAEKVEETPVEVAKEMTADGYAIAEKQEVVWNIGADPLTLDPQLNSAVDGGHVINNTFEGLVREVSGEVVPAMATEWTISEDGLVYTFKLRDAKWSDGKPVVAGDFEYAWKRAVDPALASEYAYIFASGNVLNAEEIVYGGTKKPEELGVKALDDKTLEVTLVRPTEYFLRLTAFATYMPVREDVVDPEGAWAKDSNKAISNGPFKLAEYKMGDQLVLVKNENYWNAENVYLEKITGRMIVEESTAYAAYKADEVDVNEKIPTTEIPKLIIEDETFYSMPYIGTYFYCFNMNNPVMQDVNVRKALNLAIDRTVIAEQVARGGQTPATGFTPPGFLDADGKDFNETAGDYGISVTADVEGAKAALAAAGYPDGVGFPAMEILYNTGDAHKVIAEAVQEMWKQNLGIDVKLNNQEWAVFQETRNTGTFDSIARHGWIGDYLDPNTMIEIFESPNPQNSGRYNSQEFDTELKAARNTTGKERMDHLYKAQDILMKDYPILPIYYYVNNLQVKDEVHQWELNALGKLWFGNTVILDLE